VAGQVGGNDSKAGQRLGEDMLPVIAGSRETVQQHQRFAGACVANEE
jgi:hypothetical protein